MVLAIADRLLQAWASVSDFKGFRILPDTFLIPSVRPATSVMFCDKTEDYFTVTVETPSLKATKRVFIYDYGPQNGFAAFFARLAAHTAPWSGEEVWEPLEGDMRLTATCDAVGHVALTVDLHASVHTDDQWSLTCTLMIAFGSLPPLAVQAQRFAGS